MKIVCITTSRADWNGLSVIVDPLARWYEVRVLALWDVPDIRDELLDRVPFIPGGAARGQLAQAAAMVTYDIARIFGVAMPDLAIINGDRYEALAAAYACALMGVPIAHISGGDVTEGSDDNRYRDAITALAELHFATNELAADRLMRMLGVARVCLSGDPGIDRICATPTLSRAEWQERFDIGEGTCAPVVIFHPVGVLPSLGCGAMLRALERIEKPTKAIFIAPNTDPGWMLVESQIDNFIRLHPQHRKEVNLAPADFYSWLTWGDFLIGNSSAGLHEAPLFHCPVVNIGDRQKGRPRARNVIDVDPLEEDIWWGIQCALTPRVGRIESPFGDGNATQRIVDCINAWANSREKSRAL